MLVVVPIKVENATSVHQMKHGNREKKLLIVSYVGHTAYLKPYLLLLTKYNMVKDNNIKESNRKPVL